MYLFRCINLVIVAQEAPGDEDKRCTTAVIAPTYPDTVRNLMDSYNYLQLLGDSDAVWTERSVDGNDDFDILHPTSVREI